MQNACARYRCVFARKRHLYRYHHSVRALGSDPRRRSFPCEASIHVVQSLHSDSETAGGTCMECPAGRYQGTHTQPLDHSPRTAVASQDGPPPQLTPSPQSCSSPSRCQTASTRLCSDIRRAHRAPAAPAPRPRLAPPPPQHAPRATPHPAPQRRQLQRHPSHPHRRSWGAAGLAESPWTGPGRRSRPFRARMRCSYAACQCPQRGGVAPGRWGATCE